MTLSIAIRSGLLAVCAGSAVPACAYDPDHRCGDDLAVYGDNERCVCPEGTVFSTNRCVAEPPAAGGAGGAGGASTTGDAPEGLGDPCTGPDDCAGTDATYCDTIVTQTCLVENCNVDNDDCYTGYQCCDLTMFQLPTLCVPEGTCPQ